MFYQFVTFTYEEEEKSLSNFAKKNYLQQFLVNAMIYHEIYASFVDAFYKNKTTACWWRLKMVPFAS